MKDFPTVCPPSRIPSPYSHMSIHERNSGLREVRITKGTIAKKKCTCCQDIFQYAKHNLLLPHLQIR